MKKERHFAPAHTSTISIAGGLAATGLYQQGYRIITTARESVGAMAMAIKMPSAGEGRALVWAEIRKLGLLSLTACRCSGQGYSMWRNEAESLIELIWETSVLLFVYMAMSTATMMVVFLPSLELSDFSCQAQIYSSYERLGVRSLSSPRLVLVASFHE